MKSIYTITKPIYNNGVIQRQKKEVIDRSLYPLPTHELSPELLASCAQVLQLDRSVFVSL